MDEKAIKLFSAKNLVFIATVMKDGSPQVSPVWANYEGDHILINTAEGRLKHKNILRDPRVAVSVVSHDNPLDMTTIRGTVTELIPADKLNAIVERTKKGGGELVNLMGTSAWYAPGAAAAQMVEAIVKDQKRVFPVCAWLEGEYNIKDLYLGVPVKLGKNGIEEVIELKLNADETALLNESATAVREVAEVLDNMEATA